MQERTLEGGAEVVEEEVGDHRVSLEIIVPDRQRWSLCRAGKGKK